MMKKAGSKLISFRPRARIMKTLGEELISSETVAILELVKNSFDADAKEVIIKFSGSLKSGEGFIEIADNGHGMTMDVVEKGWMEPATDLKKKNQRSPKFKRRILGEKGIGRFATSRLARELELVTKHSSSEKEIYALFDWSQFEDTSKYLDQVEVLAEIRTPEEIKKSGTVLRMNYIKKEWGKDDFNELQRGLSRLVSPFYKESDMIIKLDLPDSFSEFSQEIAPPSIIKHPHYVVKGKISAEGFFNVDMQFRESGTTEKLSGGFLWIEGQKKEFFGVTKEKFIELTEAGSESTSVKKICAGDFDFELRIWDRDELEGVTQKTKSTLQDVRRDLDAVAGINIYRDNFRVLPYGEPTDDWLKLNLRRVQKPTKRLSNNQILGYINITADGNPELKDQSNREGLNENQALQDLRSVMMYVLNEFENIRYDLRPRKKIEPDSFTPLLGLFNALNLDDLKVRLENEYPKDNKTLKIIADVERRLEDQIDEIQIVVSRYQRLATLGTLVDVVLHDGRHPLGKIVNEAFLGKEEIEKSRKKDAFINQLHKRFVSIENQGEHMSSVFRRIEPFAGRKRGRASKFYLEEVIRDAITVFESTIKKSKIKITLPKSQTLVRIDPSEIQQVLINLLDNSIYWLQLEKESKREIQIDTKRLNDDHVEIIFSDSGVGVPDKNKERIFEPYFSTKPNGVGLGLAIAGEIVSDYYNGKLELVNKGPLKGATFRVTLKNRA